MLNMLKSDGRFWAGVVLAIVCIVGYACMTIVGGSTEDARGVFIFATPFITVLLAAPVADNVVEMLRRNTESTLRTEKQTNGMLTAHVDKVATKAAEKALEKTNGNGYENG